MLFYWLFLSKKLVSRIFGQFGSFLQINIDFPLIKLLICHWTLSPLDGIDITSRGIFLELLIVHVFQATGIPEVFLLEFDCFSIANGAQKQANN